MALNRKTIASVLGAVLVVIGGWLVAGGGDDATAPTTTVTTVSTGASVSASTSAPTDDPSPSTVAVSAPAGFESVDTAELPAEALDTLALIDAGGPYPYGADDETFQNREGLLPDRPDGYYREYTVETPGSDDRGARRIVTGEEGEVYYTDDHYDSFRWVTP